MIENSHSKTGLFFWIFFCTLLGGILWRMGEPAIGFIVATALFGIAIYVTNQDKREEIFYEKHRKKWEDMVKELLYERNNIEVCATIAHNSNMPYQEYMNARRLMIKETQTMPETGFEALFSCYFLLHRFPTGDLKEIDSMIDRESRKWQGVWWRMWKNRWLPEVPSYLRKLLIDKFEKN